jgi:hypothetical protein
VYPNLGATVLAKVSIQGKPVAKGGVVAAFVGNELRGLQDVVFKRRNQLRDLKREPQWRGVGQLSGVEPG